MGLLKKPAKKKPLRTAGPSQGAAGGSNLRPVQLERQAPCVNACPSGNDVRGWLAILAQREKTGLSPEEAWDAAWRLEMETNPFPAIMGRVCPNPCEGSCNRKEKDSAVAINSVERLVGDWGIDRHLEAPKLDAGGPFPEKIAVVGAGPAGLSCAYQLARRGYPVTVFEGLPKPGGMLRYGIPEYRLPRSVIDAEVSRIAALGVEVRCDTEIGREIDFESLRRDFDATFVGIGAHTGKKLGVPGEEGPGVYTGTEFLRRANMGDPLPVGKHVVVIGGGDTAVDAARVCLRCALDAATVARREGVEVTILYRRTRTEMPAIDREVEEALEEDIKIEFLAAPAKVQRDRDGNVSGMTVQRMELGTPDASGRRRPVPIEGNVTEIPVETVITAVSQAPDCKALGAFEDVGWLEVDSWGRTSTENVWSGGDNVNLGLATEAIGQGRRAAESMHASLRGQEQAQEPKPSLLDPKRMKLGYYEAAARAQRRIMGPEERLANRTVEVDSGIALDQGLAEATRCFSCGSCFGCERCWMYCTPSCFKKVTEARPGLYYTVNVATCDGCKKCAEECPCGFLEMQ